MGIKIVRVEADQVVLAHYYGKIESARVMQDDQGCWWAKDNMNGKIYRLQGNYDKAQWPVPDEDKVQVTIEDVPPEIRRAFE
jgi:hypothetical protein